MEVLSFGQRLSGTGRLLRRENELRCEEMQHKLYKERRFFELASEGSGVVNLFRRLGKLLSHVRACPRMDMFIQEAARG